MSTESVNQMKFLFRSREDRVLAGVCGGLADYLGVEPISARTLFALSVLLFGFGVPLYIAAVLIVPAEPTVQDAEAVKEKKRGRGLGFIMLLCGTILLLWSLDLIELGWFNFHFFPWRLVWPLTLIGIGIYLLASGVTLKKVFAKLRRQAEVSLLVRKRTGKMIFGVCAGLGHYFRTDPNVIRLIWVAVTLLTEGVAVLFYIVFALVLPYEQRGHEEAGT